MGKVLTRAELLDMLAGSGQAFIVMVGVQGSGKSTLAKALKERHSFKRLSLDRMAKRSARAAELNFDALYHEYLRRIRKYLRAGHSVVDDNNNISRASRARSMSALRWLFFRQPRVIILHMDAPLEQCLAWNQLRKYPADRFDIETRWKMLQEDAPTAAEGNVLRVRPMPGEKYELLY